MVQGAKPLAKPRSVGGSVAIARHPRSVSFFASALTTNTGPFGPASGTTPRTTEPDFADKYTKNQAKYATSTAAVKGFQHLQEVHDAGYMNKDFASSKFEDGQRILAEGQGAQIRWSAASVSLFAAPDGAEVSRSTSGRSPPK